MQDNQVLISSSHLVPESVAEASDVGDADGAEVLGVVAEEHEEVGRLAVAELPLVGSEPAHVVDVPVGGPVLVQIRRRLAQNLTRFVDNILKSQYNCLTM